MSSSRRRASRPTLPMRFFRPSLEKLEDRLPPGDLTFLAGMTPDPLAPLLPPPPPAPPAPTLPTQTPTSSAPPPALAAPPAPAPASSAPAPTTAPTPAPAPSGNDQLFNTF